MSIKIRDLFLSVLLCLVTLSVWAVAVPAKEQLAATPPMGWNSFNSYGVYLHEKAAMNMNSYVSLMPIWKKLSRNVPKRLLKPMPH